MRSRPIWKHPLFWLGLMVGVFVVVSSLSSIASYENFRSTASTNTGTIAQAVASSTYGYHAPFYEAADCAARDKCSFLLVHASFLLYLAVPFYALAPTTLTLFVLQSLVIGAAALPLYWLTRQVTGSATKSLFAAGLFLVWAPLFSTYSLHVEAVLPLEILGIAALWQARRYRWGLLAALAAFLTFEVTPIFVFFVGLFFLVPYGIRWLRGRASRGLSRARAGSDPSSERPTWAASIRSAWSNREVRYTAILMAASVVAYGALLSFTNLWGGYLLGIAQPAPAGGIFGFLSTAAGGPATPLSAATTASSALWTAEFWLILLGLVAFVPLLAPRTIVVYGPWIVFTFLTNSAHFTTIGTLYPLVNTGPIFVGVAYGLVRLPWPGGSAVPAPDLRKDVDRRDSESRWLGRLARRRGWKAGLVAVLGTVVVVNVLLSPINPALPSLGYQPGAPFFSSYFNNTLDVTPGLAWTENMARAVPLSSTVAASPTTYPIVARWPYVIDMNGGIQPYADPAAMARLPFNLSGGPQYVFIEASFLSSLQPKFTNALSNASQFGLRGYVGSTAIGPILLFEQRYSGLVQRYGPTSPAVNSTSGPRAGLVTGPDGRLMANASAPGGYEIRTPPKQTSAGQIWGGPDIFLPPGTYSVRLTLAVSGALVKSDPTAPVLELVGTGFGASIPSQSIDGSQFPTTAWTTVAVSITTTTPIPEFDLEGYSVSTKVSVAVAALQIVSV